MWAGSFLLHAAITFATFTAEWLLDEIADVCIVIYGRALTCWVKKVTLHPARRKGKGHRSSRY